VIDGRRWLGMIAIVSLRLLSGCPSRRWSAGRSA